MKKIIVTMLAIFACIGLVACGGGKASKESYWDSGEECLSEAGMEALMNSVWTNFYNAEGYTKEPTYLAIMGGGEDFVVVWYGVNYQYAKGTGYDYETTYQLEYMPMLTIPCLVEKDGTEIHIYADVNSFPSDSVYDELRDFSFYIPDNSRECVYYMGSGGMTWMYHNVDHWTMDNRAVMNDLATRTKNYEEEYGQTFGDYLPGESADNGTAASAPTATPSPTPTPTPILNEKLCEKLTGQSWKMEYISSTNRGYGEPQEIIIDSISPESAMVTYVVNTGTVDGDCMGLQYKDGKYYLELECSVKVINKDRIILTSEKQMREFHAYSSKKDPLCVIELEASNISEMICTFYSWERELVLVEELPKVLTEYAGTIYGELDSLAIFQEMCAAVTQDHKLYMWGYKALNYVADNPIKGTAIEPTLVAEGVIKVFAGGNSGFVIKEDNSLWGFNDYSEYAVEKVTSDRERYLNKIADNVKSVTCDGSIIAYVREDGTVVVLEDTKACTKSAVENITGVKKLCSGDDFVLALKEDGTLWGLGDNREKVLGIEDEADYQKSYVQIMTDVADVEVSSETTFVVKTDGSLWGWGSNGYGQLGQWDFASRKLPVKIMDSVKAISYNGGTVYAITKDAALYIWGSYSPISDSSNHPKKYVGGVVGVEEYMNVLMVVKNDGNLYTAGNNYDKQLGYLSDDSSTKKLKKCLDNILLPRESD